ncbi:MAG: helicase-associated domain-containing protein, partial [Ilumatobacteraceae bacterium]
FREIAKRFGQSETIVALMFDLAERLGMVVEHSQQVGRGRNLSWQYRYSIADEALDAFDDLPTVDQWRHIVTTWIDGRSHSANGPLMSFILRQVLADLVALAPHEAIAESDFVAWIERRHLIASNLDVARSIVHLRALDLIEPTGPIALTPLARALLTDPQAVATMLPDLDDRFVVQADHTVMAPPSLDPKIRTRLETIATLVSDGGMRVYRLDTARIAHTLAAHETADDLVAFLAETSSVPLPDAVSRLIIDTDRARGGLTVAAAATIVTASDVLGLAAALKVKAAKLTMVAPTVAVSDLSPARVATALRAKGLAPATAGVTISVDARPVSHLRKVVGPSGSKAAGFASLVLDAASVATMVKVMGQ